MRDVVFIALGSNLGDRAAHLAAARAAIGALHGTRVLAETEVEETAAVGPIVQDAFLNQMIAIETELAPGALLGQLLDIERANGRRRDVRWGPRTLDLDIVACERQTVREPGLTVPHPELPNRDWWRRELAALRAMLEARA